jgi:FHS family L-fucose permease-like MFS transporter
MIIMAIVGGAVFTPLMGLVFEATRSMATAMLVPLGCYVFIAYYSFVGCRVRRRLPA